MNSALAEVVAPAKVRHLIGGRWVESEQQDLVYDPYRGTVVAEVARGTVGDIDLAVQAAVGAAPVVAAIPAYERAKILHRVASLIVEYSDEIGLLMSRETGKALVDSIAEVRRSKDTITLSAEEAIRIEGAHIPLDGSEMGASKIAFMLRFPVGVIAAVTPFNAPFNLACHKLGPAFAAGNSLVLKTPPQCPAIVNRLVELFVKAGVPDGAVNAVHGGIEVGRALVSDPRVDFVTFTGSSRAGAEIKASSGLRRVALELGGNGQTIVHSDADLETAAKLCARNSMRLAGQSCISVQSVLVHRSVYDRFVRLVVEEVSKQKAGDPLDPATVVGTLIDEDAAKRVEQWVEEAVSHGARLLHGGERNGAQITPTVLSDIRPEMKVFCEEVFGPVVSVMPYDDISDAFHLINKSRYGLQTGIFTSSNTLTMRAIRELRTGGVIINGTSTWRTDQLAYGGVKDSGIGREGPRYAIREMTDERIVLFNM
ncbi:aldehyde dehydrogenase family protein [Aminobacter sp. MSH1]|uniref:aldehyde dehydrogenase family protein n=1 Tax=Aminobacter sp. MSH1 TaxID=374606 RepID=UPI000D3C7007|nr:aldehyde dehydrogenase family protein [Aminobacter sp. MSH1]